MAPPTGAQALKGPSPPQKLPQPRSPDVPALSHRSAARSRVFVSAPRVAPSCGSCAHVDLVGHAQALCQAGRFSPGRAEGLTPTA